MKGLISDFIKKTRIQGSELFEDIEKYLSEQYAQRGKVYSRSSPFGMIIRVVVNLFMLLLYYLEDAITESNIYTARKASSIRGIASLTGHQAQRRIAATGSIECIFRPGVEKDIANNRLKILNETRIRCLTNSLTYTLKLNKDYLDLDVSKIATGSFTVSVVQGEYRESFFTGNGQKMQSFSISDKGIAENYIEVYVNGIFHRQYESFYDMQKDEHACLIKNNTSGGIDIFFGNGSFGAIPKAGSQINVRYLITAGKMGELTDARNWKWIDSGRDSEGNEIDLNEKYFVSIKDPIIFGSNEESLEFTKMIIPKKSQSFSLINADNYVAFLRRFDYFRSISVRSVRSRQSDDNTIELILLPNLKRRLGDNQNYFNLTPDQLILTPYEQNKVRTFLNRMGNQAPGLDVVFINPVIKRYAMDVIVRAFEGEEESVGPAIEAMVSDYMLNNTRDEYIPSSDFVYMFEKIPGVDSVNVYFISEDNEKELIKAHTYQSQSIPKGLDQMNDIRLGPNEIAVIRGGWKDRFGQEYMETGTTHFNFTDLQNQNTAIKKAAINIFFQPSVKRTINATLTQQYLTQ